MVKAKIGKRSHVLYQQNKSVIIAVKIDEMVLFPGRIKV